MEQFAIDPATYSMLMRSALLGLIGMIFWWVRKIYQEFKEMQKEAHKTEVAHERVQTQLAALQISQASLQNDINLIINTLLKRGRNGRRSTDVDDDY